MSDQTATTSPVQLPPARTVQLLGYDVPVLKHGTVGEVIELEELLAEPPATALRQNLAAFAVLIRHRLGVTVTADDLIASQTEFDFEAFEEGLRVLMDPFVKAYATVTTSRMARARAALEAAQALAESQLTGEPSKLAS